MRLLCLTTFIATTAFAQTPAIDSAALPPAVDRPIDFATDVHPILAENCNQCHAGDTRKGGFQLDSREALLKGAESGPVVVEGKSAESLLISLVSTPDENLMMPPKGRRLTGEEIGILRAWIDQGMVWDINAAPSAAKAKAPLQLQPVELPKSALSLSPQHPIDRLMKAYLDRHNQPVPKTVDDAVFIRRAYLDVTGLLPSTKELQAFDKVLGWTKRPQLVESLLAENTAYAENMMSFWNDHLRNDFQGTGYIDGGRQSITPWLYTALAENKPYDKFVRELVSPTPESEGFIKGIIWRGDNAAVQQPPMQAAASVSQVFLGVNLKCASCHDSFVDDWKLADAYGLANVFNESPMELIRCDVPTGEQASYKFLWPELGSIDGTLPRPQRMEQVAGLVVKPENGPFARTIVNRLWSRLMGAGLVEPLDKIENLSWYPELLDWLAQDFIDHGYNLKHTMARIMTSEAYQWPSVDELPAKEFVFRGPLVKKMSAEQFVDAVSVVTGVWQQNPKFDLPGEDAANPARSVRAWRVPADPLMRALGRPNREQVTTRRENTSTTLQALELSNGATLAQHLQGGATHFLSTPVANAGEVATVLYLQALQRAPLPDEIEVASAVLGQPVTKEGVEDFLWVLTMLPEFQLIY